MRHGGGAHFLGWFYATSRPAFLQGEVVQWLFIHYPCVHSYTWTNHHIPSHPHPPLLPTSNQSSLPSPLHKRSKFPPSPPSPLPPQAIKLPYHPHPLLLPKSNQSSLPPLLFPQQAKVGGTSILEWNSNWLCVHNVVWQITCIIATTSKDSCTKKRYCQGALAIVRIRPTTCLHFVQEIAVSISKSLY